jgi:hypothetical protein
VEGRARRQARREGGPQREGHLQSSVTATRTRRAHSHGRYNRERQRRRRCFTRARGANRSGGASIPNARDGVLLRVALWVRATEGSQVWLCTVMTQCFRREATTKPSACRSGRRQAPARMQTWDRGIACGYGGARDCSRDRTGVREDSSAMMSRQRFGDVADARMGFASARGKGQNDIRARAGLARQAPAHVTCLFPAD